MSAHLSFSYQLKQQSFDLDISIETNEPVIGLFGPSGAGKSTLLHCIAGIQRADSGRLSLGNQVLEDGQNLYLPAFRRRCGMIFQTSRLFPHMTVLENLAFGFKHRTAGLESRFGVDEIIAMLDLQELVHKRPVWLSGGEAQRVAIGRALLADPLLLLLDEPLTGLDRGRKRQILPILRMIRRKLGIPMVYVSHDLSEILQLTDFLAVIQQGRLVAMGPFLDLVRQPQVLDLFYDLGLLNVLPLRLLENQPVEGTSQFQPELGSSESAPWVGPVHGKPPGSIIYAMLRPEDISLVREPVANISIRNQLNARIEDIVIHGNQALCILDLGVRLLVGITPDAINSMGLCSGQQIWCLFKAQALTYLD